MDLSVNGFIHSEFTPILRLLLVYVVLVVVVYVLFQKSIVLCRKVRYCRTDRRKLVIVFGIEDLIGPRGKESDDKDKWSS